MPEIKEAVCVDCKRVYDSCADKDCISDLGVLFTTVGQPIIDAASSIKCRDCSVLDCLIDVEEVPFNHGFYSVDITYYFKLVFDAYVSPLGPATQVEGLASFSKKAILFGSDGRVKTFSSEFAYEEFDEQLLSGSTDPIAKVQCVDPISMDTKICVPCNGTMQTSAGIPEPIRRSFQGDFTLLEAPEKSVIVTLGLFSIVQLERDVQILIPTYDFAIPCKECSCETDNPCDAFKKIQFPVDEFFPPNIGSTLRSDFVGPKSDTGCGCGD